ncbi:hypothetical protein HA466_0220190 [Hirschfeldia incana]|nr:hypothetical protein HA466_0220190 [Hirschfeldia incana]
MSVEMLWIDEHKQQGKSYTPLEETDESLHVETSGEFEFSEIFVHQFFSHHRNLCLELFPTPLLTCVYGLSVCTFRDIIGFL